MIQLLLFIDETVSDDKWALIAYELHRRVQKATSEGQAMIFESERDRILRMHPAARESYEHAKATAA